MNAQARASKTTCRRRAHGLRTLLLSVVLVVFVGWGSALVTPTYAASTSGSRQSISAAIGYGGYYKPEDWVPVTLTIRNVGPAQSAKLQLSVGQSLPVGTQLGGALVWPVQLPANRVIKKQIEVPGPVLEAGATVVCTANGKRLAQVDLDGNSVDHVALVAVLSNSNQDTQFLSGSSSSSYPVLPVAVDPRWLPTSVNLLDGLTAVVASVTALNGLSQAQRYALQTWVKLGGTLIVSGTGLANAGWRSVLPLKPGAERTVNANDLAIFAGSNVHLRNVEIQVGGVAAKARLWAGTNQSPLLTSTDLGRGEIWQTAFAPNDPALLGWSGNPLVWTAVFKHSTETSVSAMPQLFDAGGALSLSAVGDALAPLRIPSLPVFALIFGIYILVVGPVTFIVLRRLRRTHFAWVLLPLMSVVMTFSIYLFGGAQRPNGMLMDGVGVLDLTGDGSAESYAVQALMSPYPGGLEFQLPSGMLAVPMTVNENLGAANAQVTYQNSTNLLFHNVGRWRVRYVYAAGASQHQGELVTHFTSAYGLLFGTIRNQTPYTLDHLAVVWDNHMYELGTMKPGQTVHLDPTSATDSSQWISDYGTYNRALTRGIGRSLGAYLSQLAVNTSAQMTPTASQMSQAMLIATTAKRTAAMPEPAHEQDVTSDRTLVLVRQFAGVEPEIGDVLP